MNPPMPGIPPHWAVYFAVDDIEAAAQAAAAGGAQVLNPPTKMPGVGTMAHLADPGGAAFALMQPEETSG
jgi:predicted enzyme related to lactoylglutathione lyase